MVEGTAAAVAPRERSILAALLLVQVLFGGLAVASKLVLPHVPPLALALCRLAAAAVVLVALERTFVRSRRPPPRDLAAFAVFALLGVVLNQGLFLEGLQRSTATNAVLLVATIPTWTLLVAVLLGREKTGPWKVAGLALSFSGVALLVIGSLDLGLERALGNAMIVANALSYSIYLVLSKPYLARYDPLTVVAWTFVFGTAMMSLVAAPSLARADWGAMDAAAWTGFGYAIVLGTIVTYGVNNWALRYASASHVANFVYLQPVVGAVAAYVVLGESLGWRVGIAGALVLAGVWVATRRFESRRAGRPF